MGQPLESLPIPSLHLRRAWVREKFWRRPRLGRGRSAAPRENRAVSDRPRHRSVARALESRAAHWKGRRKQGTRQGLLTAKAADERSILARRQKAFRFRARQEQSPGGRAHRARDRADVV